MKHQLIRTKKFALGLVLLSLFATGCNPSDARIQQLMVGTWDIDQGDGVHGTLMIAPDGNFKSQFTGYRGGHTVILDGTGFIKDGVWVETITKNNTTNAVPRVSHNRIVHVNAHDYVIRPDGDLFDVVANKVEN